MKQLSRTAILFRSAVLIGFVACAQRREAERESAKSDAESTKAAFRDTTFVQSNTTTILSSDIDRLSKLLDFKTYKPVKVRFKYVVTDNSGQNRRLTIPGPSDYSLQTLLYFDSLTFEQFLEFDRHADYPAPDYNKEDFKFDWLDKEILTELKNSDKDYRGHPDFFFGTAHGKSWYLHRKILLSDAAR